MKTKIVYVLVSSEKDIYLEQAFVSMSSVKYHTPSAYIIIVTDDTTYNNLKGIRKQETILADEIVVVEIDAGIKAQKRSRILKTGLRNYINGDYLFIDTDTIIVKDISAIDNYQNGEIWAAWDTHTRLHNNPYKDKCIKHVNKIGGTLDGEDIYFNSGVMLVKDSCITHDFYKRWTQNYLKGYEKNVSMDQPSLAKSNIEAKHLIRTLPAIWNCQFKHGIKYLKDAYIIHYLVTNKNNGGVPPFMMNDTSIFEEIKRTGKIPQTVKKLFDDPFAGIASVTHLFSGDDVFFFRTNLFKFTSYLYSRKSICYNILAFIPDLLYAMNEKFDLKNIIIKTLHKTNK